MTVSNSPLRIAEDSGGGIHNPDLPRQAVKLSPELTAQVLALAAGTPTAAGLSGKFGVSICADCPAKFAKNGPMQIYCEPCSDRRNAARQAKWRKNNPPTTEQNKAAGLRARSRLVDAGNDRNKGTELALDWTSEQEPEMVWLTRFAVPFTYAASKNHIYANRSTGHVSLRRESRSIRDLIEHKTRKQANGLPVVQAKVYIDILAQKPNHRGDAVNVVDLVCDGIKRGLGVDDRWFCLRRVDWQIVKTDPQLIIGIAQADRHHLQVCSHCGIIQKLTQFRKKRTNKMGVDRVCRGCHQAAIAKPGE